MRVEMIIGMLLVDPVVDHRDDVRMRGGVDLPDPPPISKFFFILEVSEKRLITSPLDSAVDPEDDPEEQSIFL